MLAHGYQLQQSGHLNFQLPVPFQIAIRFFVFGLFVVSFVLRVWLEGYIKRQGRFSASVAVSSLVRRSALGAIRSRWLRRSRTCPLQWIRMCSVARSEDASTLALVIWHA